MRFRKVGRHSKAEYYGLNINLLFVLYYFVLFTGSLNVGENRDFQDRLDGSNIWRSYKLTKFISAPKMTLACFRSDVFDLRKNR